MPVRPRLAAGLAGVVVLVGAWFGASDSASGAGSEAAPPRVPPLTPVTTAAPPASPLVLISGRDDHGELAAALVELYAAPGGRTPVGEAPDGTLARVVGLDGTWLHVRTLEGPRIDGWVDDFHLRRELHLVGAAPSCRATLDGRALPAGEQAVVTELVGGRARVRLVHGSAAGWVARASVHELAPREGCAEDHITRTGVGHHH
ncbi:MAG: hypothetical protein HOQ27_08955 [Dermatophilaceae bacterium]|nr:hypothetical protein [Dermatophilaceae bacterium]